MKTSLKNKAIGFYVLAAAAVLAVISLVRFLVWAPAHSALNPLTLVSLLVGVAINAVLLAKDNDYLVIAMTACYTVAVGKLLSDSVGSFVDAFQGISMFGDATQVGTIISIAAVLGIAVVLSIAAGFMPRVKE